MKDRAYAKINLSLDVFNIREDGYHDLNMVMLPLELHDSIEIETSPVLSDCFITTDHVDLQVAKFNLITKTVTEMKKRYGIKQNFIINVHKEIPISAGLGGGSSNSAAVIKAIKSLTKLKLDPEEEINLGSIQTMLGHENITTTEIYSHISNERVKTDYTKHPHYK